ncbi:DGQHR domain-containing protein [Undibacterium sp. Xuan67W]|uniref:DGQHR domain-containing protein n=1 Tax=Undibacterium sp. Xuan67W TaxID=3413057 RepID=UPI003BF32104
MKNAKTLQCLLEDQVWCLFFRLGYETLSSENFKIGIEDLSHNQIEKEISVLAKDDETVVVAICRSKESRGRKSLSKELNEFANHQKAIANSIKKSFEANFRPKIIWMIVTQNIIWSEADVQTANEKHIRIVTENELQYFDAFAKHLGPAGRFQFLAEFLEGQEIPELKGIKVPATRGTLGNHAFYSFVTTPRDLLKISFVNHQALNHPAGRPTYQRMISQSRIKEIGEFIKKGGYFPTNLLINFVDKCKFDYLSNKENANSDIKFGWLHLPSKYKSAWIIDGQHRLYGYSHLEDRFLDQSLVVIAFERMDTKTEADLFVTINQKQKSVQKSVIVSLQSDLKWGSTDAKERGAALASRLAKTISADPTSPFFQRFTIQGVVGKENQSLTIPEFVNGISRSGLLGKNVQKTWIPGPLAASTDDKTIDRARKFLNLYFSRIQEANTERWEQAKSGFIATNPGVRGHMLMLADLIKHIETMDDIESQTLDVASLFEKISEFLQPVENFITHGKQTEIQEKFGRKFGEGGVKEYADNLCELIHLKFSNFGSAEFLIRLEEKSEERVRDANQDTVEISQKISDVVISKLKERFGTKDTKSGEKAYWDLGIQKPKIKTDAYDRQQQDSLEKRGPKENYLNILDFKEIVKSNWDIFSSIFNIKMASEQKGKTYYLDWMDRFNELRRIAAHPSSTRGYADEDLEFLDFIKEEFYSRLKTINMAA